MLCWLYRSISWWCNFSKMFPRRIRKSWSELWNGRNVSKISNLYLASSRLWFFSVIKDYLRYLLDKASQIYSPREALLFDLIMHFCVCGVSLRSSGEISVFLVTLVFANSRKFRFCSSFNLLDLQASARNARNYFSLLCASCTAPNGRHRLRHSTS